MTIIGDVYEPKLYNFAARVVRDAGACDVLDLASNDGRGTILIARMNSGTQVTAADLNEEAIAEGRKKTGGAESPLFC